MPGVLLDDGPNYQLDNMSRSSFYDPFTSFSPTLTHSQAQQLMRHSSFSGLNTTSSGLSHSAPVYHRSQSAISSVAAMQAFNYLSPPTTPKKSTEAGFSTMSSMSDLGDDYSSFGESEGSVGGMSAASASSVAMAISGNSVTGDLRSLAFGNNSAIVGSPTLPDSVAALHKYLPSNNEDEETWCASVVDVYACDQFRMFEFKVRRCMRGRSHDWTECPFAHPGEKARRRDPRRFHYSGTACPDFRKGSCRRGDACEFAHGVFECWLHPARYRTQPCKDGRNCRRRVCFFAHTPEQLRLLPAAAHAANAAARTGGGGQGSALSGAGSLSGSYDGSLGRNGVSFDGAYAFDGCVSHGNCQNAVSGHCGALFDQPYVANGGGAHARHCCVSPQMSSPTSTLVGHSLSPPPLSPPLSPSGSPPMSPQSPHHWLSPPASHQALSSCSRAPAQVAFSQASLQASQAQQQGGFSQSGPGSPLSRGPNNHSAMYAAVAATAHAHSITPAHRRHLDRLNSMPTLSIPAVDHTHRGMLQSVSSPLSSPSSCSPPSPGGAANSATAVSDLIATIQQLGLRGSAFPMWIQAQSLQAAANAAASSNQYSTGPSPLRRCSQSVPCTPTKLRWEDRSPRWAMEENSEDTESPVQRVESGRDLRAKIYGKVGKDHRTEGGDAPDLGWVNELVKDEQAW